MKMDNFRNTERAPYAARVQPLALQATLRLLEGARGDLQKALNHRLKTKAIGSTYQDLRSEIANLDKFIADWTVFELGQRRPDDVEDAKEQRRFLEKQRDIIEGLVKIYSEIFIEIAAETDEMPEELFTMFFAKVVRIQNLLEIKGNFPTTFRDKLGREFLEILTKR